MSLVKPRAGPGFLSQATQVQAVGNWYAGNLVRWRTGLLEKMDGWHRLIEESIGYVMRRFHAWLDLDNRKNLLIAADDGVHLLVDIRLDRGDGQGAGPRRPWPDVCVHFAGLDWPQDHSGRDDLQGQGAGSRWL